MNIASEPGRPDPGSNSSDVRTVDPHARRLVRVHAMTYEAEGIYSLELRDHSGAILPPFTAGAHIDVTVPRDLSRSYSLINSQDERHRYVVAVSRDANSRGGSAYLCEKLRVGDTIEISNPSNTFPLEERAVSSVLIAGGIGVTPVLSMVERLEVIGQPWKLYFAARTRRSAAFLARFQKLEEYRPGRVSVTFDQEPGQSMLDIGAIIREQPPGTHFYCCGPIGMLKAFESATVGLEPDLVHTEFFTSAAAPARGGFEVVLARSKKTVLVPEGKSILDTLNEMGMRIAYSCKEGVCGTCETKVLEGIPDHRDAVLSKRERESNKKIMVCCSGCVGDRLVLDL